MVKCIRPPDIRGPLLHQTEVLFSVSCIDDVSDGQVAEMFEQFRFVQLLFTVQPPLQQSKQIAIVVVFQEATHAGQVCGKGLGRNHVGIRMLQRIRVNIVLNISLQFDCDGNPQEQCLG